LTLTTTLAQRLPKPILDFFVNLDGRTRKFTDLFLEGVEDEELKEKRTTKKVKEKEVTRS